jgi:hypothetical protein
MGGVNQTTKGLEKANNRKSYRKVAPNFKRLGLKAENERLKKKVEELEKLLVLAEK